MSRCANVYVILLNEYIFYFTKHFDSELVLHWRAATKKVNSTNSVPT